ncbi:MAG: DNA-protecting protein DprA [Nannocystaceae bacterium]|nr:DNA-protecting protein DprA [Nannocystaceae bacterium]
MIRGRCIDAATLGVPGRRSFELHGTLPPRPRLAIVGSRAMLHAAADAIAVLVEVAAAHGHALVSGGAIGVDATAHHAALARALPQLAVLPCGADRPYPPVHAPLFAAIAAAPGSGLLYSQPRGTIPARAMFVSRNATLVALADAVVVVMAERRSGSEVTGRLALRRGLPTAVLAGTEGCAALAAAGARTLASLRGEPEALALAARAWLRGEATAPRWPPGLAVLQRALAAAGAAGATLDRLGGPAAAMALIQAERLGLVQQVGPGRWVAVA